MNLSPSINSSVNSEWDGKVSAHLIELVFFLLLILFALYSKSVPIISVFCAFISHLMPKTERKPEPYAHMGDRGQSPLTNLTKRYIKCGGRLGGV